MNTFLSDLLSLLEDQQEMDQELKIFKKQLRIPQNRAGTPVRERATYRRLDLELLLPLIWCQAPEFRAGGCGRTRFRVGNLEDLGSSSFRSILKWFKLFTNPPPSGDIAQNAHIQLTKRWKLDEIIESPIPVYASAIEEELNGATQKRKLDQKHQIPYVGIP